MQTSIDRASEPYAVPLDQPARLPADTAAVAPRQRWLAVLSRAHTAELEALWQAHGAATAADAGCRLLRRPECGLIMLRGRIGGTGAPFNFGEATVSRCAVTGPAGVIGVGYTLGRDLRKAELIAAFDWLLQHLSDNAAGERLQAAVVEPLAVEQAAVRAAAVADTATSRVEFFTMVRGD